MATQGNLSYSQSKQIYHNLVDDVCSKPLNALFEYINH